MIERKKQRDINLSRRQSTTIGETMRRAAPGLVLSEASAMRLLLVALVWLGAAVRVQGLFSAGLHPDEALFASWARAIAVWRDPLLQWQVVDKPPLLFYLQALFFPVVGSAEPWVVRLPNLLASLLAIPLIAQLVWLLYRDRLASAIAALLVTLSPLAAQSSAGGFTDPLLSFLLLAALATAVAIAPDSRGAAAGGFIFGLALATKHQAWLFLPLLLGLLWLRQWQPRGIGRWAAGAALPMLALAGWDLARGGRFSLWSLQIQGYGGLRPAWSWELWPRLEAWAQQWELVWGSPLLAFFLILGLPLFLALLISEQDWATAYDQLFVVFAGAYALLHWVVAVPVWERYLLPVVPLTAVLLGRFISRVLSFVAPGLPLTLRQLQGGAFLATLLLLAPASTPWQNTLSAGATGAAVADVAAQLEDEPYGAVLYDHWFSWQWRYYLFDSGVYVSWFAHPAALVEDLQVFGHDGSPRYLVVPGGIGGDAARPVLRAVTAAGFSLQPLYEAEEITLYRLAGSPAGSSRDSR